MSTPLIDARGLCVVKDGRLILDHVDFTLEPEELITIVGPNGSGKTTLIRLLMGVEAPTSGTVRRRPGLRTGYLPQKVHIDPVLPLTVRRLLTLTRRASRADCLAALDEVGAPHLLDAQVHGLSGGEFQRAMLARALIHKPDILFLDEPTQAVDYAGQIDLYKLIADLRRRLGCAVVMISHDLHVVMAATDRVVCLHHHVCCVGKPETVSRDPNYQRLLGADAARHLALYRHDDVHHMHDAAHYGAAHHGAAPPAPPAPPRSDGAPE